MTPIVTSAPTDRLWTIPNALSVLRLLGVPLFLWLLLGPHADALGARRPDGLRVHRLVGRCAGPQAQPDERARRAARPARRPALHPRHARRAGPAARHPAVAGRRDRRARSRPGVGAAAVAPRGVRAAVRALPRQGRDASACCTRSRCCCIGTYHGPVADFARPVAWAFTIWGTALYLWSGVVYLIQVTGLIRRPVRTASGAREPARADPASMIERSSRPGCSTTSSPTPSTAGTAPRTSAGTATPGGAGTTGRWSPLGCLLIGFVVVVAYVRTNRGAPAAARVHERLVDRVRDGRALRRRPGRVARRRATPAGRARRTRRCRPAGRSRATWPPTETAAGQLALRGPGLQVTLRDPDASRHRRAAPGAAAPSRSARRISSPTVTSAAWSTSCGPTAPRPSR